MMYPLTSSESNDIKPNLSVIMNMDGYQNSSNGVLTSGIPTRTTPTLTPTTLKNIEESFMDLHSHSIPPAPMEHHRQAGFIPPVVNMSNLSQSSDSNGSYEEGSYSAKMEESHWLPSCMQQASPSPNSNASSTSSGTSKPRSGRKSKDGRARLSPEEEERRRVRRERNKLAAARCRKRRMDHTNSLLEETEGLEDKRQALQDEIQSLSSQKEELEFLLEAHKSNCKKTHQQQQQAHHSNHPQQRTSKESNSVISFGSNKSSAPQRPTSLSINNYYGMPPNSNNHMFKRSSAQFSESSSIPISTPSNGILNFDSLMDGGTGFTPVGSGLTPITGLMPIVSASCAGQQRSSSSDLSSPDSMNPPKLVSL